MLKGRGIKLGPMLGPEVAAATVTLTTTRPLATPHKHGTGCPGRNFDRTNDRLDAFCSPKCPLSDATERIGGCPLARDTEARELTARARAAWAVCFVRRVVATTPIGRAWRAYADIKRRMYVN
jgi:hypothetical protein